MFCWCFAVDKSRAKNRAAFAASVDVLFYNVFILTFNSLYFTLINLLRRVKPANELVIVKGVKLWRYKHCLFVCPSSIKITLIYIWWTVFFSFFEHRVLAKFIRWAKFIWAANILLLRWFEVSELNWNAAYRLHWLVGSVEFQLLIDH